MRRNVGNFGAAEFPTKSGQIHYLLMRVAAAASSRRTLT